jgi:outer membrane protein TolC
MRYVLFVWLALPVPLFAGTTGDSLGVYVQQAIENDPGARAAFRAYEAAVQRARGSGGFDDPVLEMGFFLEPMELAGGRQVGQLQVMQMFPWFGTRRAAREEMDHMARMAFEEFRAAADEVQARVAEGWYALCVARERERAGEEGLRLLEQLERLARQRFAAGEGRGAVATPGTRAPAAAPATATGGSMGMEMGGAPAGESAGMSTGMSSGGMGSMGATTGMSAVLQVRLEAAEAESEVESARSALATALARFNLLLGRPATAPVSLPDSCLLLDYTLDVPAAMEAARTWNPMLGMLREEGEARAAAAGMARRMGLPMWGVGVQYMLMAKMRGDMAMEGMNGRDMVMPMVSISIPFARGKYRAARTEQLLLQQASEERLKATARQLEADLHALRHELDEATRALALARRLASLVRTAYELVTREFASGRGSLEDLLQLRRRIIGYALDEVAAVVNFNMGVIKVQRLVSCPRPISFNCN